MYLIKTASLIIVLLLEGFAGMDSLVVKREDLNLRVYPTHHHLAIFTNMLWDDFHIQSSPTPSIAEGLFTLYGYSETAWGVAKLRADEYERLLSLGMAVPTAAGGMFVELRDCGVDRFRDCLRSRGFAGVLALKADDIGRIAKVQFWDSERRAWTPSVRMLVLDSLGSGWDRLQHTSHPLNDEVWMRWMGDVSKDTLEDVGLGRLVRNNWSGFMRVVFEEAYDYNIVWPNYE